MSNTKSILLIHPPVSKPCEPPAGIARLARALRTGGVDCRVWDADIEGLQWLIRKPMIPIDTWTRRALVKIEPHLAAMRAGTLYANADRYKKTVMDLNRVLFMNGRAMGARISFSDYSDPKLSPVQSADLIQAACGFEANAFYPFFAERLFTLFQEKTPDLLGFSVNFMSQALCAFAMAGFIRKYFPHIQIILGGGLITSWMAIPGFRNPFDGIIDELVDGPGEAALLAMCGAEPTERGSFWGSDYSAFPLKDYLSPGLILPYSTAGGCYWRRCGFCPEKAQGGKYRPLNPGAVTNELGHLVGSLQPALIHFLDNALSPKFLRHLISHPPGAPWYGFVRITEHLTDPDFTAGLRRSGCVMLKLGVESGDQAVLDALEKGIQVATISKALRALKATAIATYVYLLFGTPAETPASAEKTLAFTAAHADAIDFLNLAVFNLPAYSADAATLETGEFYPGDLSLYREFRHPHGWNRDHVRRFLAKTFTSHPAIRPIIQANPQFFTSNHAAFLIRK